MLETLGCPDTTTGEQYAEAAADSHPESAGLPPVACRNEGCVVSASRPVTDVYVVLRDQPDRFRVQHIVSRSLCGARIQQCDSLTEVDLADIDGDTARSSDAVLIISLREIDAPARETLLAKAALGARILVLVDDDRNAPWGRLAGMPLGGCLSTGELSERTLLSALRRMRAGELPMSANLVHALLSRVDGHRPDTDEVSRIRMTPREQQTLVLLAEGLSNKQIARQLGISLHGAKRLVANILAKLDCDNRTSAVSRALREGLYTQCRRTAAQAVPANV